MRKKIFLSLLTVLFILIIWQHELIFYVIKQGQGQLSVIENSVDLSKILEDDSFPDSVKNKIKIIQEARKFATHELGLKDTENYTTFFDQNGKTILWNVSASRPYSFDPKTWWFPVVGNVPYNGFFDKEKAIEVRAELVRKGWEVRVRPVGGWSTLGWFKDPILSSMLNRSEGQLAELIIHELTHGSVFVKGEIEFNENLASFIGEQGARQFLKKNYGLDSEPLVSYINSELDQKKFTKHILTGTKKLDSLYRLFPEEMQLDEKRVQKERLIKEICESVDTVNFSNNRFDGIFSKNRPNNAYFMSFLRYYSAGDSLNQIWQNEYNSDLSLLIKDFVDLYGS